MKKTILLITVFFCFLKFGHAQAGQLDPLFGNNGIVTTDLGSPVNYDTYATQVLRKNDSSFYVVIYSNKQTLIGRRLPDGSIDSSYGYHGFSVPVEVAGKAVLQDDGKIVVAGNRIARFDTNGSLDTTFNKTGIITTEPGSDFGAVNIQRDGKILVAGSASDGLLRIERYNTNGSLDNIFSSDGIATISFDSEVVFSNAIVIQKDGKIIIVGSAYDRQNSFRVAIARINTDGSLDETYNNGELPVSNYRYSSRAAAIQRDEKIVVLAHGISFGDKLIRFNTDGSVDSSFANLIDSGYSYQANNLVIQNDDKIVVVGHNYPYGFNTSDFVIFRYNSDGSIDNTFSGDGIDTTNFGSTVQTANSVVIQNDGKILVAGVVLPGNVPGARLAMALKKYNNNGTPDAAFGVNGKLKDYIKQGSTNYNSSLVQKDGKIVAGGSTWNGANYDFLITRYDLTGRLDKAFNSAGFTTINFGSANDYINSITIQSDGKIVAAGYTENNGYKQFATARVNIDGSIDSTFDYDGKQTTNFNDTSDIGYSVAIQSDGKIVVAGSAGPNETRNNIDIALARYNIDGSLDESFSEDGLLTTDVVGGLNDIAKSLAIQTDGKIVLGGNSDFSFTLVRYNTDGTLDKGFANEGKQTFSFSEYSYVNAIAIQKDGKIVACGTAAGLGYYSDQFAYVVARYNTDGSYDTTFNNNGTNLYFAGENKNCSSIAIQSDGKIVIGGTTTLPNNVEPYFAVARLNSSGSIDDSFGSNGIQITSVGTNESLNSISIDGNKLYAVGSSQIPGSQGVIVRYLLDNETKAPTVTLSIPYNITKYSRPARIKLNAAVANVNSAIQKVQFFDGTTLLHTEDVAPYGFLWVNVPAGNYTLTAKAFDNNGNVITSDAINVSVVDSNVAPVVSIVSPVGDTTYSGPATIRLIADAKDPNDKISKVAFYNGTTLLRTEYYYPYTYTWTNVQPGTYTITALATDNKGVSTTSEPVTVTVTNASIVSRPSFDINKKGISLRLSPNPASNILQIYTKGLQQNKTSTISVISASGVVMETIRSNAFNEVVQLDVSSMVSGVYIVKVVSGDKILYKQFVKL